MDRSRSKLRKKRFLVTATIINKACCHAALMPQCRLPWCSGAAASLALHSLPNVKNDESAVARLNPSHRATCCIRALAHVPGDLITVTLRTTRKII